MPDPGDRRGEGSKVRQLSNAPARVWFPAFRKPSPAGTGRRHSAETARLQQFTRRHNTDQYAAPTAMTW